MAETGKRREDNAAGIVRAVESWLTLGAEAAGAADEEGGEFRVVHGLGAAGPGEISAIRKARETALTILRRSEWHDFGPTFATELSRANGIDEVAQRDSCVVRMIRRRIVEAVSNTSVVLFTAGDRGGAVRGTGAMGTSDHELGWND